MCLHFSTNTPSQREIFLGKLLLWLVRMEFHFSTSTPSQREIFCYCGLFRESLFQVIWILVSFQIPLEACQIQKRAHPPKVKYSLSRCYCGLFVWSFLLGPAHPPKEKYSVHVACSEREQATITALRQIYIT